MHCYTTGLTKQGLYAAAAYHWVILLFSRKKVQPRLTVHALFSLSYLVIIFHFCEAKNVGVLMAVQPTSIYLIVGKYNLNASGKRCLLETDVSVWCDTVILASPDHNFSNLNQSTAFRLVFKYLSQSSIATNIGTLYSLIVRAQSELSYHQMSLVTQCVMMRPLWLTSAHCH